MRSGVSKPKAGRATLKDQCIADAREFLHPGRVAAYEKMGVMPVLASAEGYRFRDVDGRKYQDFHLNGGTFNLGHRNRELIAILKRGFRKIGIGNHHFVNCARARLAKRLVGSVPGAQYAVFAASGGEANDVAIKSARHTTGRRKIVSMHGGYHGRTGLSGSAGDAENAKFFRSALPEFSTVEFNDLNAMANALKARDVAAIIVESLPATAGFLRPAPGYLAALSDLCEEFGTLYIADEVQTGLGRTGALWSFSQLGGRPDILVTAKGLSGGIYPIAATVLSQRAGTWLTESGWGHVSTFGGADVACEIALRVLEICSDESHLEHANAVADYIKAGLRDIQSRHGFLEQIHGAGLAMGLEFDSPSGGVDMMRALYERGLWAMFASFNSAILQFKPGFLIEFGLCDEALQRLEEAVKAVKLQPRRGPVRLAGGVDQLSDIAPATA